MDIYDDYLVAVFNLQVFPGLISVKMMIYLKHYRQVLYIGCTKFNK